MKSRSFVLPILLVILTLGLNAQERSSPTLFRPLPSEETGIVHRNDIIETESFYMSVFIYAYNGAGVGIGDVNGDDLPDIYFLGTQAHAPSRLYLNRGGMKFEDASRESGLFDSVGIRFGVTMVDIDGDDDLDIYVTRQKDPNRLYINDGKGHFTDRASEFGLDHCCSSMHASFLDFDRDGDLDLYLGINGKAFERNPMVLGLPDKFFRNDNGKFVDVTESVGIYDKAYCQSLIVGDINNDGWMDIYVTSDFQEMDLLYINNRDGTFSDEMRQRLRHTSASAMGSEIADINNDGQLDIVALDMMPEGHFRKMANVSSLSVFSPNFDSTQMVRNTMHLNRGDGYFSDIGEMAGVSATDWSWAPLLIDADHDRDRDLFITNGFKRDVQNLDVIQYFDPHTSKLNLLQRIPAVRVPNYFYRNEDGYTFTKVSNEWGVDQVINSNGAAWGDLDQDGDLDLVINNLDTFAMILENRAERLEKNWVQIELHGSGKNRMAIGARVTLFDKKGIQTGELITARGYLSSSEPVIHFGLGDVDEIDSIIVEWPDGRWSVHDDVDVGKRRSIDQKKVQLRSGLSPREQAFRDQSNRVRPITMVMDDTPLAFAHNENSYHDFHIQRLTPRRYSINGPAMAVGDINGDLTDDLWVSGSGLYSGQIFLQGGDGKIESRRSNALVADSTFEDQGGVLIDVDGDEDLDLVVVSGGNEYYKSEERYRVRLYLNDGSGEFTRSIDGTPDVYLNGQTISAADVDGDNDLDLFVGGRLVPESYPDSPRSVLLLNEGGRFVDASATHAPGIERVGMVTASLFTDHDNDGDPDLMLVGEWMTPRLFRNDGGRFVDATQSAGLQGYEGWWNSIAGGDLDNDGDIDYILGNLGLNTKTEIRASREEPYRLYAGDFDGNGSRDLVSSYYQDGIEYPSRTKADVEQQMKTYINRKFPTPSRYARSTLRMIYDSTLLAEALTREATTFASMVAENQGDGTFILRRLPPAAQIAPIHGILIEDIDADGNLDVLIADNFFGPDGSAILYDAGLGLLMKGDGLGGLRPLEPLESGLRIGCDVRSLVMMRDRSHNGLYLVAACNSSNAQVYRFAENGIVVGLDQLHGGDKPTAATIKFEDGTSRRVELYDGSGYLSTQSRSIVLPRGRGKVEVTLYRGSRKLWSGPIETGG